MFKPIFLTSNSILMKKALTFVLLLASSFLSAQSNDSLTMNEAYNYSVGDTFQYSVYDRGSSIYRFKPQQIVIKEKKVDFFGEITTYIRQIEEYKLVQTGPVSAYPFYSNLTEIMRVRMSNDKVKASPCPIITNPSRFDYCYDSIKTDYGGRKTLKHEYLYVNASAWRKEHYVAGLGRALFYLTGADGVFDEISLKYYNKNGQTWGNYDSTIVKELRKIKPLLVREVYDFDLGDVLIYAHKLYEPVFSSILKTQYERRTILSKMKNTKGDSITYTYKSERFFKDSLKKMPERIDTLIVTDLDSIAINKFKPNPSSPGFKTYASDTYLNFCPDRKLNTRHLFCDNCDYGMVLWVGQGAGITLTQVLSFSPTESRLIYFKKGSETWGTPIDFPVGINTPSVSTPKITLSPNPTSDILTIHTDIIFNKLRIINTNGQLVLEENNVQSINTTHLPNGIYFLQIFEGSILRGVMKFVK